MRFLLLFISGILLSHGGKLGTTEQNQYNPIKEFEIESGSSSGEEGLDDASAEAQAQVINAVSPIVHSQPTTASSFAPQSAVFPAIPQGSVPPILISNPLPFSIQQPALPVVKPSSMPVQKRSSSPVIQQPSQVLPVPTKTAGLVQQSLFISSIQK